MYFLFVGMYFFRVSPKYLRILYFYLYEIIYNLASLRHATTYLSKADSRSRWDQIHIMSPKWQKRLSFFGQNFMENLFMCIEYVLTIPVIDRKCPEIVKNDVRRRWPAERVALFQERFPPGSEFLTLGKLSNHNFASKYVFGSQKIRKLGQLMAKLPHHRSPIPKTFVQACLQEEKKLIRRGRLFKAVRINHSPSRPR
jgi:hypothetical protein